MSTGDAVLAMNISESQLREGGNQQATAEAQPWLLIAGYLSGARVGQIQSGSKSSVQLLVFPSPLEDRVSRMVAVAYGSLLLQLRLNVWSEAPAGEARFF